MKYRRLGSTDLHVSVVGVGAWQFGGEWGKEYSSNEVDGILGAAKDSGINLIDTAECYGDHLSEVLVGERIQGERDQWVLATKFGHKFTGLFERDRLFGPEAVQKQLEDSLRALRTDHVDLYQFHSGTDEEFATDGLWEMLDKQVQAGKIRHLGISIGSNRNVHQTRQAPTVGASTIQVVYNRLNRAPEDEVLPACRDLDLGVLARVPLASGFLSGKYKRGDTFPENDVRSRRSPEQLEKTLSEVEEIQRQEVPDGVPMATWALSWCLQHPAVTCVIPGCKTPEQARANAEAASLDLVRDDHPQAVSR